jgi:hypothetical protein
VWKKVKLKEIFSLLLKVQTGSEALEVHIFSGYRRFFTRDLNSRA